MAKKDPTKPNYSQPIPSNKRPAGVNFAPYDSALKSWNTFRRMLKVAKDVEATALSRLARTRVANYEVTGGNLNIGFSVTQPAWPYKDFPKNSLNETHYLVGFDGVTNGLKKSDVIRHDKYNISIPYGGAAKAFTTNSKNKVIDVYSHKKGLNPRTQYTGDWWAWAFWHNIDSEGTLISYIPTNYDPPRSEGYNPDNWFLFNNCDDVEWWTQVVAYRKRLYNKLVSVTKEVNAAITRVQNDAKARGVKNFNVFGTTTTTTTGGSGTGSNHGTTGTGGSGGGAKPNTDLIYNMPSVNESYFSDTAGGHGDIASNVLFVDAGNKPVGPIKDMAELWDGRSHKGMIKTFVTMGELSSTNGFWAKPGNSSKNTINDLNRHPFAFQFLYNPSTVTMDYSGAPQVDPGKMVSGQDKVPLIASSATSSTVSFSLVLNRMSDLKYADAIISGSLEPKQVYNWVPPGTIKRGSKDTELITAQSEVKRIKELGTMYDVEFLLQTLVGYRLPSLLRTGAGKYTADIGYLGAYPVELHLGKNLRYLGTIDSFSLSHTIFTADMVPVFSNISITFNRLPEFQNANAWKNNYK